MQPGYRMGVTTTSDPLPAPIERADVRRPWWRQRPTHRVSRWILRANLVGQIGIVLTGGIVRLTASGLGCSTWPSCEPGHFTPVVHAATSWHPFIEFGNRTVTGLLGAIALLTAWVVWPRQDRSQSYRVLGLVPILGVLTQAVVGGVIVLLHLHPGWVATHFLISMALVAASTALLVRDAEGDGPPTALVGGTLRTLTRASVPLVVVVLALGVVTTGAGPHSGDDEVGYRFALDPVAVSKVHAGAVWLFGLAVLALAVLAVLGRVVPTVRNAALVLLAVTALQGLIGYAQYFTGLPEVLVATHMLGAALLVVAEVRVVLALRERATPVGAPTSRVHG